MTVTSSGLQYFRDAECKGYMILIANIEWSDGTHGYQKCRYRLNRLLKKLDFQDAPMSGASWKLINKAQDWDATIDSIKDFKSPSNLKFLTFYISKKDFNERCDVFKVKKSDDVV